MTNKLQIIKDYIRDEMGCDEEIASDTDLLETGILDSFSIVQTAVFLQEQFGIQLDAEDLVRANLSTLSNMVAMIDKQKEKEKENNI